MIVNIGHDYLWMAIFKLKVLIIMIYFLMFLNITICVMLSIVALYNVKLK